MSSNIQDPSSPGGSSSELNVTGSKNTPVSPIFSIPTCTPSPTASINSQLSPCSMKENYDPSVNCSEQARCQEVIGSRLSVKNNHYPITDMTIQLNIIPIQLHEVPKTSLCQSKTMIRRKRSGNNKLRYKKKESNLSVIERHKKLGDEALNKLKNEVQTFAADHTYKETARKFGIHHSTVSGWIKQSSSKKPEKLNLHEKNHFNNLCRNENCIKRHFGCIAPNENKGNKEHTSETMSCDCKKESHDNNDGKNSGLTNQVNSNLINLGDIRTLK